MLAALIQAVACGKDLLVRAFLNFKWSSFKRCLGYAIKTNPGNIQATFRRLLLQRICAYSTPRVLADYLVQAGLSDVFLTFLTVGFRPMPSEKLDFRNW